jgi:hypothetical protein
MASFLLQLKRRFFAKIPWNVLLLQVPDCSHLFTTCCTCFFCLCFLRRHLAKENRKQSECTPCMHTGILSMGRGPPLVALALNKAIRILSDAVTLECSIP